MVYNGHIKRVVTSTEHGRYKMAKQNIIGKTVTITNKDSWHYLDWGIVVAADDDGYYSVAIFGDKNCCPIFERNEIRVKRTK